MEARDAEQFVSDSVARLTRIQAGWVYAVDAEHRIPHRVSSGIAEQYLSVAVDQVQPRHLVATVANPTAGLWTVPITNDIQPESAVKPIQAANTRALSPRYAGDYLA